MVGEEAVKGISQTSAPLAKWLQVTSSYMKVNRLRLVGGTRILALGGLLV